MNILFLPLNKKETLWGAVIAAVYLPVSFLMETLVPASRYSLVCIFALLALAAVLLCAKGFWKQSVLNISLLGKGLLLKPLLAVIVCRVLCIFLNDILLLYGFPFFVGSDWGPFLWDARGAALSLAAEYGFWLIALTAVVVMPIVEEFLFRGVIFGSLYPKHSVIAVVLTVVLFALFHTLPYLGSNDNTLYWAVYFFQHIPTALALCWLYTATDSIFAPILMHVILNAMLIF